MEDLYEEQLSAFYTHGMPKELVQQILMVQEKANKYDKLSNSEKYNECNPRNDSYCIFEKEAKELREIVVLLKEKLEWANNHLHNDKDPPTGEWKKYLEVLQVTLQNILEGKNAK